MRELLNIKMSRGTLKTYKFFAIRLTLGLSRSPADWMRRFVR